MDPFAEAFLQESLGHAKWTTFSARLFELRLTGPRTKSKRQPTANADGPPVETTATVINFLCKAEAVKEVLRTYVPSVILPLIPNEAKVFYCTDIHTTHIKLLHTILLKHRVAV